MSDDGPVRYRDAGVDIEQADRLVGEIGTLARATRIPGVLADVGGFASLFSLKEALSEPMDDPVLVASTDGVGTKLKVAFAAGRHGSVGVDLVAMCVNDLLTTGATPLFFLDYFGTGKLEPAVAVDVVRGIAEGCKQAGCALIGGETAELPGLYGAGEYDLAGFAVGVVDRSQVVDGTACVDRDAVIGIGSRGLHSNGYSLARKVLRSDEPGVLSEPLSKEDPRPLVDVLLEPTPIYADLVAALKRAARVKAMAHITGGGLPGNLPRVLPTGVGAELDPRSWSVPPVFRAIAERGPVEPEEMAKTFNMGIGLAVVVAPEDADAALRAAHQVGENAQIIGRLRTGIDGIRWVTS